MALFFAFVNHLPEIAPWLSITIVLGIAGWSAYRLSIAPEIPGQKALLVGFSQIIVAGLVWLAIHNYVLTLLLSIQWALLVPELVFIKSKKTYLRTSLCPMQGAPRPQDGG